MRHSFRSRSLFLEARLLRFAGGDVPKNEPKPDLVEKEDPAAMLNEFRGMEKDGPAGAEKVSELDQKVKQVEAECEAMLKEIKDRSGNSPRWKEMYERYATEMKGIHLKSPDAQTKIDALTATMGRLGDELRSAVVKPRELLDDKQRQEFDNMFNATRAMVDAVRDGTSRGIDGDLHVVNDLLGAADPAVRDAFFSEFKVRREGTVVKAKDGSRYIFTVGSDDTLKYELLAPDAKEEKQSQPAAKDESKETEKKPDQAAPEKENDAPQQTMEQMIAEVRAQLPDMLALAGIAAERIAELAPKLMQVVEKHAEVLQDVGDNVYTPENVQRIMQQPDLPSAIAEIQKIGEEKGWTAEVTEAMCTFVNDVHEAFASVGAADEKNAETPLDIPDADPAAPATQPKDAVDQAKNTIDRISTDLNKPKKMTEEEKTSIVDAGKKILEEYKKIDKPTKAQSEQARGQLMMAGVDATAGVDAFAKNPEGVKAKEGTEFQVAMNKIMGFVIYVMSIVQEMKDTVNGKEDEKKDGEKKKGDEKEGAERTKETARAGIDVHVEELKKFNEADEFSASGNGADTLKALNESTAAYVKDFGGEADVTQSVIDGVGTLYDVDSNDFVTVAYDPVEKTYSFVPAEEGEKPADKQADEHPEQTREKALEAAKKKTDDAQFDEMLTVDADVDVRRAAIEAVLKAIDEEISLMNKGELSDKAMVSRMQALTRLKGSYEDDLVGLDAKPDGAEPASEEGGEGNDEAESIENLRQQSVDLQTKLDALDDKRAEELSDEELDQVKQLRKEKAEVDRKIADAEAGE